MNDNCPASTDHVTSREPMCLLLSLSMLMRKSLFKDWDMEENLHSIQSNTTTKTPILVIVKERVLPGGRM